MVAYTETKGKITADGPGGDGSGEPLEDRDASTRGQGLVVLVEPGYTK